MQAEHGKIGINEVREALTHLKIYICNEKVSGIFCNLEQEASIEYEMWEQNVMKNYKEKMHPSLFGQENVLSIRICFAGVSELVCSQQVLG
jgi:hypothetical protein